MNIVTIGIIGAVIAVLISAMYIMTAKDKSKAFTKLLIVLFLIAGVISLLGYAFLYTPIGDTFNIISQKSPTSGKFLIF